MKSTAPYAYDCALQLYRDQLFSENQETAVPQMTPDNCFETFRLSANMALDPAPMTTTHPSFWAVISTVGHFEFGGLGIWDSGQWYPLRTEQAGGIRIENILTVRTSLNIMNAPFVGERYQLEFFLPWKPIDIDD